MLELKAHQYRIWALTFMLLMQISIASYAQSALTRTEMLSGNVDFDITVYPASGKNMILWIAPTYGFHKGQYQLAAILAKQGIEVWMVDLPEMLFLPRGSRFMKQLSGQYVSELIIRMHQQAGKKILLMSSFYGAIPVLRGAHKWQLSKPDTPYLTGALLFSPVMYAKIPSLGRNPVFLPDVNVSNIPIMIFQGEKSSNRWQLSHLLEKLYRKDAPVYAQIMPGVTSLFYKEAKNNMTDRYLNSLPSRINQAIRILEYTSTSTQAIQKSQSTIKHSALDTELMSFKGNTHPHAIELYNVEGKKIILKNYKGKVTLINFWASWCPPCVKEIPSLNRLKKYMRGKAFEIISINYAESSEQINKFLKNFNVKFPILLDPDGTISKQWNVFVFPSTFVIGPDGKIQYGVNAAIEWDSADTIKKLEGLLSP